MNATQIQFILPAEHRYLRLLAPALAIFIEGIAELEAIAFNLDLVTDEAFTNVVDHAYPEEVGKVQVVFSLDQTNGCFEASFTDYGQPFSQHISKFPPSFWQKCITPEGELYLLNEVPEPDVEQIRGRGFFLMKSLLDEVSCEVTEHCNVWRLTKQYR